MQWLVVFEDSSSMQVVRRHHAADHITYLSANTAELLIAGGLREGPGTDFPGEQSCE